MTNGEWASMPIWRFKLSQNLLREALRSRLQDKSSIIYKKNDKNTK